MLSKQLSTTCTSSYRIFSSQALASPRAEDKITCSINWRKTKYSMNQKKYFFEDSTEKLIVCLWKAKQQESGNTQMHNHIVVWRTATIYDLRMYSTVIWLTCLETRTKSWSTALSKRNYSLLYEVNDKILAEDCGACRLILDHDTFHRLFNIGKSPFSKECVSTFRQVFTLGWLVNVRATDFLQKELKFGWFDPAITEIEGC